MLLGDANSQRRRRRRTSSSASSQMNLLLENRTPRAFSLALSVTGSAQRRNPVARVCRNASRRRADDLYVSQVTSIFHKRRNEHSFTRGNATVAGGGDGGRATWTRHFRRLTLREAGWKLIERGGGRGARQEEEKERYPPQSRKPRRSL